MAVSKRGDKFRIFFKPFDERIALTIPAKSEAEARAMESLILRACKRGTYAALDDETRELVVKMFDNQGWELPDELCAPVQPDAVLTFWEACGLFMKYPTVVNSPSRWRYEIGLNHLTDFFGRNISLKKIWIPELRQYQADRQQHGAAADTINRELSTLSRLFEVMIELQLVDLNPCRSIKRLSNKAGERQVYLSGYTVAEIACKAPEWFQPMMWTAYYTGMRRGEILGLTRRSLKLDKRMIVLSPHDTKEAAWKRVPIHQDLVGILDHVLQSPPLLSGRVFALRDDKGLRDINVETFKNPWPRACEALNFESPLPRFHDLRHTWKTNARRSKMDPEIREAILGHSAKQRSVSERYGRISDQELLEAIDVMTFDHGDTEIFVSSESAKAHHSRTISASKKNRSCGNMT